MEFLKRFKKTVSKMDGVVTTAPAPAYWFDTGCYVLNKIISGSLYKGIPQGRMVGLCGFSGTGKSYVAANIIKSAQAQGAIIVVIDSENALDDEFMIKIGVDVKEESNYFYNGVMTINHVVEIVSEFLNGYKEEYDVYNPKAPKVLFVIDSLDMLMTKSELDNFLKGDQKGDQGQKTKQLKAMLKSMVNGIKPHNISMLVTGQVYKNQDLLNGEGIWIINNAIRYALSQIILFTKLKLKAKDGKSIDGIIMKAEGFKTRFTLPHQKVSIKVPYETGMDPYSGLVETLTALGILTKAGSWYSCKTLDIKFQAKNIGKYADSLLPLIEENDGSFIDVSTVIDLVDDIETETEDETKTRRQKKALSN